MKTIQKLRCTKANFSAAKSGLQAEHGGSSCAPKNKWNFCGGNMRYDSTRLTGKIGAAGTSFTRRFQFALKPLF
jgi:hypothetical protein